MAVCLIGLGSNLGDRSRLLAEALVRLQRHPDIEVLRQSGYHETRPAGGPDAQPAFLNAVAVLQTAISPQALLAELQKVEAGLGRGAPVLRVAANTGGREPSTLICCFTTT